MKGVNFTFFRNKYLLLVRMVNKIEIIFVRHGESCANILKEKNPLNVSRFSHKDPQLTERGVERSNLANASLAALIQTVWGDNKRYMIGASAMMRAQMTAYYQLASFVKKPIHIFPHICEKGVTVDNIPYDKPEQQNLLRQRDPKILQYLNSGKDYRSVQTKFTKSDFTLFMDWVKNNLSLFKATSKGSVRLVVFTHGHFIKSAFPLSEGISLGKNPLKNETIMNNGFLYTQFHIGPTDFPNFAVFHDKTKYILPYTCPDKCTKSICKTKGGTQSKTRKKHRT